MHACEEVLGPAVPAVAMHVVPGIAGRRVEVPDKLEMGEMRECDLLRYTCCAMGERACSSSSESFAVVSQWR